MCGITGFLGGKRTDLPAALDQLERMADSMRDRGPDGDGYWFDADHRVGLAHRRLAVLELSPAGHQPMHSPTDRFVITFNGEIYNHEEIRQQLRAAGNDAAWRGHSDTETLLAAIEAWGVAGALNRVIGMFAFALWDKARHRLVLARDRLGEKPLYYGFQGHGADRLFLFASELDALIHHSGFAPEIDRQSLSLLLRYNYIPSPHSIYRGIGKLTPGTFLTLEGGVAAEPVIETYWSATRAATDGVAHPLQVSPQAAVDQLEALLSDSVRQQMIADVPVGAFLSGGVDSSTVVALMSRQSARPVRTFSIGFREDKFSEAEHAAAVARHLGTDHTELFLTGDDALAAVPGIAQIYDEPFADSSQLPTYLVSKLARRDVTVSLSGDGGDELFAGYRNYAISAALWKRISAVPRLARRGLASALLAVPPSAWSGAASLLRPVTPRGAPLDRVGDRIHKAAPLLNSSSHAEFYRSFVSHWRNPSEVVIGGSEPPLGDRLPKLNGLNTIEQMMATDLVTYLSDDILTKVDRAAMAVSLETRVPLLDHRVVEFAWRLPFEYKRRGNVTKWVLRELLYRYVPQALVDRPKMGFAIPLRQWLRGPLRDWAESLLAENRLRSEGYFDPTIVREAWHAHLGGSVNLDGRLWSILMFQSWLEARRGAARPSLPFARRPVSLAG